MKTKASEHTGRGSGNLLVESNHHLQETAQQFFMAKQELEKKNHDLEKAGHIEHVLNERLEASIEYFSNIVERTTDGILVVNNDGIVKYSNESAGIMFARTKEEFSGTDFGISVVSGSSCEIDIIRPAGEKGTAEMRVVETVWKGNPGLLITLHDVTERRRAELALRGSEEKFKLLFEESPSGIAMVDTEGFLLEANTCLLKLLGLGREELIGKKFMELVAGFGLDSREQIANFRERLAGGLPMNELTFVTPGGGRTTISVQSSTLMREGRAAGVLYIVNDITERKRAGEKQKKIEEQLRQFQKLEAIGQLSSGVAHDFNNLLGGIMGHAELLKMNLDPESPLLRHPEVIISSCEKAADLTRQLLSFARKAPVEFQKIDLNAFLKQVVGLMDRTIDRRIEIVTNIPDEPAFIFGDRNQLENALLNIAINARDAMPQGGHLNITLKTVDLKKAVLADEHFEVAEGLYALISIADAGTGMSREIKERIFEPFFTTKEVGKGTGLGLASVYGCVKQHNGYITVQSQEGKGTQFNLYFPIAGSGGPAASQKSEILVHGKGTLLVVDDEPVFHEILTKIFTGLGYGVRCCAGGAEAVEYYREHASGIAVVILDMNMPKMSGLQCFRRLKEINPGVRVVVSSGYGDNIDRAALKEGGVNAFIQKPYKAAELSMKIAELVNAT
jgi:two-component system cell cycle sensor histidine kinase/response regulator CckA